MLKPWQRPLYTCRLTECRSYLEEASLALDLDLMEELAAKMADVLIIWRRSQQPEPAYYTFSDGTTRNLTAMDASHAACEVFPDWDGEDS